MKYIIKGKDKNTGEVIECLAFRNKEPAQSYLTKLVELFSQGYDFWIESQPGVMKIIRSCKTRKGEQNED